MSVSDVFGDALTRVRNAQAGKLRKTTVIYSKMVLALCKILKEEGYISDYLVSQDQRLIELELRYVEKRKPVIKLIKRVSTPSCAIYKRCKNLKPAFKGLGIEILTTSKGVLPSYKAKELKVGGKVLCCVF